MKEDYDTMGPEATIQTTGNNGTGELLHDVSIAFLLCRVQLDVHEVTKQFLSCFPFNNWETFT